MRSLLVVGYLCLAVAVLVARRTPAQSYEVSIYQSTPVWFWVGVGIAIFVSFVVMAVAPRSRFAIGALPLAGGAITGISALPLIRQYYFYGFNDSLTHLGWAKSLVTEMMDPSQIVYPGSHITAGMLSSVLGLQVSTTMMLVVLLFSLLHLIFVPLIVYAIVPDRRAVLVAAFSAFLFLPVNLNGFKLMFFPYSLASFFGLLLLFLFFKHQFSPDRETTRLGRYVSPATALFVIGTLAMVSFHLQVAANFLIIFCVAAAIQFVTSYLDDSKTHGQRPVYAMTAIFAIAFVYWMSQHSVGTSTSSIFIDSVLTALTGSSSSVDAISQRSDSVSAVGGSIFEVFAKLFMLKAVYAVMTFALFLALLVRRPRSLYTRGRSILLTLTLSLVVLVPYFFAHLLGDISGTNFFFRHVGFAMLLATIVGSVTLYYVFLSLGRSRFSATLKSGAPVGGVLVVAVALLVLFPSPYIFLPSNHVSDQQVQGHDDAFAVTSEEVPYVGIRSNPHRYAEALPSSPNQSFTVATPEEALFDLSSYYGSPRYLMVSERSYEEEVVAYKELRYSKQSFEVVRNQPQVGRVMSNGAIDLYYIDA